MTSLTGNLARQSGGKGSCPAYPQMVNDALAAKPAVIVVSGGRNDATRSVSAAAAALFTDLHKKAPKARIIAISPIWDDSSIPADFLGTKAG